MSMLKLLGRRAPSLAPRAPLPCATRCFASQWPGLRHTLARRPLLARFQSTTTTTPTVAKESAKYMFPALLNVYRSGVFTTVSLGFFRIITVAFIFLGVMIAPNFYFDPDKSNWWIPAVLVGAVVPYSVLVFVQGPVVHSVYIRLPIHARQSKVALLRFVESVPPSAWLRLECIRFVPWPTKKEVQFGYLRTFKPSFRMGLANLEYTPVYSAELKGKSLWQEIIQRWQGRYYVRMDQKRDRAQATGLWKTIWKQIPELGSKNDKLLKMVSKERKPVAMANRAVSNKPPPPTAPRTVKRPERR